jgi:hypothetical protein
VIFAFTEVLNMSEEKILNPDTNRYVLKTGKTGKKILANAKAKLSHCTDSRNTAKQDITNFMSINNRLILKNLIIRKLIETNLNSGTIKCLFNDIKPHIDIYKTIGKGSFGIVSLVNFKINSHCADSSVSSSSRQKSHTTANIPNFALKQTRLRPIRADITEDNMTSIVHEVNYLITRINPLIEQKISPNFPYTYSNYICNNCSIIKHPHLDNTNFEPEHKKCSVYLTELATGDLSQLDKVLSDSMTNVLLIDDILFNMYFQLMYAVSVLHKHVGILHNDIKQENILYYSIPEGGYYKYIINNETFYLPNIGYLLILNDFGVSDELYPNNIDLHRKSYKLCEFGTINKQKKFNITIPSENVGKFGNYTYSQYIKYLKKLNIEIDTINSTNYINPIQSNDIMDLIYTFIGGNRCTQGGISGIHSGLTLFNKSNKFKKRIYKLLNITEKQNTFGNWRDTDHYVWQRFKYGTSKENENGLYISGIHNLLKIFKNKYKNEPLENEIIETYNYL